MGVLRPKPPIASLTLRSHAMEFAGANERVGSDTQGRAQSGLKLQAQHFCRPDPIRHWRLDASIGRYISDSSVFPYIPPPCYC